MVPGTGTAVNVVAVVLGACLGRLLGDRLPERTRSLVTDALGLVTLLIAAGSAAAVGDPALTDAVGDSAPLLIVLASLVLGGIIGSALGLEQRLELLGSWLQRRLGADRGETAPSTSRSTFVEGFVVASLVFCTGPLTILGALNDGLGNGGEQLYLKATLDGFAAIAFAASFGWGVAASALTIVVVQGGLTLLGLALGDVLPPAELAAITAVGGLVLVGVAFRLLRLREVAVVDLLPALLVAPLLVAAVAAVR